MFAGDTWQRTMHKDPVDEDEIIVPAFTGNNDLGLPHADIARNMRHNRPDVMALKGDYLYENVRLERVTMARGQSSRWGLRLSIDRGGEPR